MVLRTPEIVPEHHIIELEYDTIDIEVKVFSSILRLHLDTLTEDIDTSDTAKLEILPFKSPRR
jgi:hypothetical protein